MSEDNKDFGDKAEDSFDKAKDKANEFAGEAKEAANEFADEAKKAANEFTEGAKEAMDELGGENKKLIAGILAIVLGSLGIHKFILGYQKEGIIMLVCTVALGAITCGIGASVMGLIGLIEGIIYLTKSDAEFYNTYQVGRKPWF
ncbi:NINE protein [Aggregatimonas sangjinii]|uniref:NINE protein n=1 Tax=Aggregatimonas sangjinii TaxID=2583587 RepID=A0A5B7SS98_9FLAO|nr:NINE protein [Aggregatimonas sangjinii]QCX01397.1 NINE protein [Aggregatimonas sangjinii]